MVAGHDIRINVTTINLLCVSRLKSICEQASLHQPGKSGALQ